MAQDRKFLAHFDRDHDCIRVIVLNTCFKFGEVTDLIKDLLKAQDSYEQYKLDRGLSLRE